MTGTAGSYYEFFAGGGMARAGLGADWQCLFSNDFDHKKSRSYRDNWGDDTLLTLDVRGLTTSMLPKCADLVWASFPCQDLSLAGGGAGLKGERSGTFWPFWDLMIELGKEKRPPQAIVLENVCGTLSSHQGKDFKAICDALVFAGYKFGAVIMDAVLFVPHSRPRLFIVAVHETAEIPDAVVSDSPSQLWHSRALVRAQGNLSPNSQRNWIWWNIGTPSKRTKRFADLIEDNPESVCWHSKAETCQLLSMMSQINLDKVVQAKRSGKKMVGAVYKRTRYDEKGFKVQRAEIRFDDVAGCLRTPGGGSSRQLIMTVDGDIVRSRLISTRETARLMGLPDSYKLPENYNEAYHLTGDGIVVPVVRHLSANILEPIFKFNKVKAKEAA